MPKLQSLKPRTQGMPKTNLQSVDPDSWRAGKTTAERGYGGRWQRERLGFLARNVLCVYCERNGRICEATVVDHIEPHRGDQKLFWNQKNWQALCRECHDSINNAEEG
jgi:5-methylcytosine-specific restriction protein A